MPGAFVSSLEALYHRVLTNPCEVCSFGEMEGEMVEQLAQVQSLGSGRV